MKTFRSEEIKGLALETDPALTIGTCEAGGDVDTVRVSISKPTWDDRITVCGFRVDNDYGIERDNVEAEMLELRNSNADSDGGIQTDNEELAVIAARLKVRLTKAGWRVIDQLGDYF